MPYINNVATLPPVTCIAMLYTLTKIESIHQTSSKKVQSIHIFPFRFRALGIDRAVENAELQDKLDKAQNELRRAQAELRLNQSDYERSQVEMEQMQEKVEKSQGEIYRLRAKLENTQAENENIQEEFDKIQQALSRSYAERDKYAGEMDKTREELERVQVSCHCDQIIFLNYLGSEFSVVLLKANLKIRCGFSLRERS